MHATADIHPTYTDWRYRPSAVVGQRWPVVGFTREGAVRRSGARAGWARIHIALSRNANAASSRAMRDFHAAGVTGFQAAASFFASSLRNW